MVNLRLRIALRHLSFLLVKLSSNITYFIVEVVDFGSVIIIVEIICAIARSHVLTHCV